MADQTSTTLSTAQPTSELDVRALNARLEAVTAIGAALSSSVGLDALFREIVPNVSRLMRAERTTLFLFDAAKKEIWSKVAEGEGTREIRLALGQGIAGWVAAYKMPLNIGNAYEDPRFNAEVDARTGFRTQSVAAVPVVDKQELLIGVLQVLNRQGPGGGPFTDADLGLLQAIATQAAYAIENAQLAEHILEKNKELDAAQKRAERRSAELDLLYRLEQETSASTNLDDLLSSILGHTCDRMRSEAGSVLLLDNDTGKLFFRGVTGPKTDDLTQVRLEPGEGIVGWVAEKGQPLIVNTPADDPRHKQTLAEKLDYPAQAIIAVPLVWDHKVIGAMEVLNPLPRSSGAVGYDLEDLKVLTVIAGQVARALSLALERQAREGTERLALIGRMLAGVAHDLRNPMTVISGFAQLMAMETDTKARGQHCDRVLYQVDEMTHMIADLLAFARGDSRLRLAEIDLPTLSKVVHDTLTLQCQPRSIELVVQGAEGTLNADLGRVKRIIYNLARNAVEVLGQGDRLSITMTRDEHGLSLRVEDNGPGLPEGLTERLFTPFVSLNKAQGTGLGLSIVKRFVDDHQGRISVESEKGRGTTFIVTLPNAKGSAS